MSENRRYVNPHTGLEPQEEAVVLAQLAATLSVGRTHITRLKQSGSMGSPTYGQQLMEDAKYLLHLAVEAVDVSAR